jgi:hypothetical protein
MCCGTGTDVSGKPVASLFFNISGSFVLIKDISVSLLQDHVAYSMQLLSGCRTG